MLPSKLILRNDLPARMLLLFIIMFITIPLHSNPGKNGSIRLEKNKFRIVFSDKEPGPLKIALEAFKKDF
jgi:hypothetical protein